MNSDSFEDADVRLFREEYPAVYEFVLKFLDGRGDDALLQAFAAEHGDAALEYFLKILTDKTSKKDIQEFREEFGDELCNVILKMVQKKKRQHRDLAESGPPLKKFQKGDFIGQKYEVFDVLGEGGFGIVYLVYSHETKSVYALKTFRDEYLKDIKIRERFRKEAQVWIDLERHPYLVRAYFVDEISGRLYVAMEHIAPDEQGLTTLDAYLRKKPPDLAQTLRWGIQFCYGMEYAYLRGIKAHRDIKPTNIMITQDNTIKISDFGLAGIINAPALLGIKSGIQKYEATAQTAAGTGFGTPPYMAPEQFENAAGCNETSDVYSFGIVLYRMVSDGRLPFYIGIQSGKYESSFQAWYTLHCKSPVPQLRSPLFPVIQKCLKKEADERYRTFGELRMMLESLLKRNFGEVIEPPESSVLDEAELLNKGLSLCDLGKPQDAIKYFNKALEINPRDANTWHSKGVALEKIGKIEDALACYNQALSLNPQFVGSWVNKGLLLSALGRLQEAITCCNNAIKIDSRNAEAWRNKGIVLGKVGKAENSIACYDQALSLNPQIAETWFIKGIALGTLNKRQEEMSCYDKTLEIDQRHSKAWTNKGTCFSMLGNHLQAIDCFNKALEIDPEDVNAWNNKGIVLVYLGEEREAIFCLNKTLELNPGNAYAWNFNGIVLFNQAKKQEAAICFDKALEINPHYAEARSNKDKCL